MAINLLGIRHHGLGSALRVKERLEEMQPDIVLIEGPPEITEMLGMIGTEGLNPPVALMVYNIDNPKQSSFYPFAEFSPEWVAANYANENKIPIKALDLPAAVTFKKQDLSQQASVDEAAEKAAKDLIENEEQEFVINNNQLVQRKAPLSYFAELAGFRNGEEWWEYQFEKQQTVESAADHFEAVLLTMKTLRGEGIPTSLDQENIDREVYMRQVIREMQNEMYTNIAIICGAWHTPALQDIEGHEKSDKKLFKKIPKSRTKVMATWIPWTNDRLSMYSGYGAGIQSPGWSEHCWKTEEALEVNWLTKVATTFREKQMDISTAHVIEAFHLANGLTALRNKSRVSLQELNEATQTVMCMGDGIMLELIKEELIIGNRLGEVPPEIPKVPLQEDFEKVIKSLRLKLTAAEKQYDLDLRKAIDLKRSILFHRLALLEIPWATPTVSRTKGTFKESWVLEWSPEMMVGLIDKAYLGNTIEFAARTVVTKAGKESNQISELAKLIGKSIPAELFTSIQFLLDRILELTSISSDIVDLMTAIPSLVDVARYGDVRKSDVSVLEDIIDKLFTKICINLSNACYGLDEDNSNRVFQLIANVNDAVRLFENKDIEEAWIRALFQLVDKDGVHHIILGCTCRLLLDAQAFEEEEASQKIAYYLSVANDPYDVAAWIEGFLRGSGMILIYDDRLWNLIYTWVSSLPEEIFMELLPYLRRAFSKFEFGERRQIGEKAKRGLMQEDPLKEQIVMDNFDESEAVKILPVLQKLMSK